MRLNKWLAEQGVASRRHCDRMIKEGKVGINNRQAEVADKVAIGDDIYVDAIKVGRVAVAADRTFLAFAYHKPVGEICSRVDSRQRPLAYAEAIGALVKSPPSSARSHHLTGNDALSRGRSSKNFLLDQRWMMVGRLDINSSGLLLFVNSGDLCHRLMHPSNEIDRVYRVRIGGELSDLAKRSLLDGVALDGVLAKFNSIRELKPEQRHHRYNRWYEVALSQGINREIRRLFAAVNRPVSKLCRVRYGNISLGNLKLGQSVLINRRQLDRLKKLVNL